MFTHYLAHVAGLDAHQSAKKSKWQLTSYGYKSAKNSASLDDL